MAELQFFTGTMDSGKSTLALQTNHNHAARGRQGQIFVTRDRAGTGRLSSRLGLTHDAIEVDSDFDFWRHVVDHLTQGGRIDYLICDEAQFYSPEQIDALAKIVDELQIDVFAFGILTDFRTLMFPGSARLVELADRMNVLQVEALCWCGKRATHNARTENGVMVVEGDVIVVGDVEQPDHHDADVDVAYEVLCRQHHRRRLTAARAKGLPGYRLLVKYPLRVAINFMVGDIGHLLPSVISGAELVAIVLSLPTTGPILISALQSQDMYLAGSFLMFLSLLTVVGVLISDIALAYLDPRIRLGGGVRK